MCFLDCLEFLCPVPQRCGKRTGHSEQNIVVEKGCTPARNALVREKGWVWRPGSYLPLPEPQSVPQSASWNESIEVDWKLLSQDHKSDSSSALTISSDFYSTLCYFRFQFRITNIRNDYGPKPCRWNFRLIVGFKRDEKLRVVIFLRVVFFLISILKPLCLLRVTSR